MVNRQLVPVQKWRMRTIGPHHNCIENTIQYIYAKNVFIFTPSGIMGVVIAILH